MSAGGGPRFEVRVIDAVLAEDLSRCTKAARAAIEPVVAEVLRDGVPYEWWRRCEAEGHDGAVIPNSSGRRASTRLPIAG